MKSNVTLKTRSPRPKGLCMAGSIPVYRERGKLQPRNFAGMLFGTRDKYNKPSTPLDPFPFALPNPLRWLGLAVLIIGIGLAVGGFYQLGGLENIDHLVDTGIFAKLRHPMYTDFILWIMGWIVFNGAAMSLLIGGICICCVLHWRRIEERNLKNQFSEKYQRYKKQTWF